MSASMVSITLTLSSIFSGLSSLNPVQRYDDVQYYKSYTSLVLVESFTLSSSEALVFRLYNLSCCGEGDGFSSGAERDCLRNSIRSVVVRGQV